MQLSARLIDPHRSYDDAVAGRRGLRKIADRRRSSAATSSSTSSATGVQASHLAIARDRPSGGKLDTVEGNTSNAVRLERRGTKYIVLAARVTGDA